MCRPRALHDGGGTGRRARTPAAHRGGPRVRSTRTTGPVRRPPPLGRDRHLGGGRASSSSTSAAAFGRELEDPFEAPGLDSHRATELLTRAGSADMGLGADVVLTPRDPARDLRRRAGAACRRWTGSRPALAALPHVLGTQRPRVARRPGRPDPGPVPRAAPSCRRPTWRTSRRPSTTSATPRQLRIEAGGDLYFAFEQAPAGVGEVLGLAVAIVILLLAFGSVVAMGLPIGTALLGLAVGVRLDVPGGVRRRHPQLGVGDRVHGRARGRHRLRAVHRDPASASTSPKAATSRTRSAAPWPPPAGRSSSPAAPSSWRSWAWPSPGSRSSPPAGSASP